jgi:hypothetical protein
MRWVGRMIGMIGVWGARLASASAEQESLDGTTYKHLQLSYKCMGMIPDSNRFGGHIYKHDD